MEFVYIFVLIWHTESVHRDLRCFLKEGVGGKLLGLFGR